ncbi:unnamed protein product [Clonostachys chloroleuca]|uniref:Uncharacterized protein n=1 Tax=Clonostachys chloroleuca TaxID=1926264 RepID=A0AA35M5R8_9HYPO|nr:unnamed protein product [Clonostachys chloroleuca]CAI6090761.1 unnamed protein product [Clonostachys chloroleuca]
MNKEILSRRWPGSILELAQKRLTQAPTAYSESPSLYHYRTDLSLFTLGPVTKHEHGRQHGSELLYSRCSVGRDIGPESQNSNVSSSTSTCKDNISEISVDVNSDSDDDCNNDKDTYVGPAPPQRNQPAVIVANDVESDNDSEIPTNVNSDEPEDFNDHDDTSTNSDGLEDFNNEDNITINSDKPDYSKGIEVEKYSGLSANPAPKELEQFDDPAVIVSKDIEWAVDENQGLLGARRLGEEWEFLTPFETTFEPDYKLLNCEELIKKFNADYGPSKRPGTTRAVEPRDPEKELIYPINKEGFVGREYVDGELRYGVSWPSMWLPESALGEKLIDDFWREFLGIEGNIEVFKSNKRRQDYKVSTKKKRRRKHDDIDSLGDMRSL